MSSSSSSSTSRCIIRQLLYERSEIDSFPLLRGPKQVCVWQRQSQDPIACDVHVFEQITQQHGALLLNLFARAQAAAVAQDKTEFRHYCQAMPAASLLSLLQQINDAQRIERMGNANDSDHDDTTTTTSLDDNTVIEMTPVLSTRHVAFSDDLVSSYHDIPRLESIDNTSTIKQQLWWTKAEMKAMRMACVEMANETCLSPQGWEYIETISQLLNQEENHDNDNNKPISAELQVLQRHATCRGLERHVCDELLDYQVMHRMCVLQAQDECRQGPGNAHDRAMALAETAYETSRLSQQLALVLAKLDLETSRDENVNGDE